MSESEKRIAFVILLFLVVALLIVVAIGFLIHKAMRAQAKRIETEVYDVVTLKVVKNKKEFKSYARRKNGRIFVKQIWIPILLISIAAIVLLVRGIIKNNFAYNPLNKNDGFLTVLWLWDFQNPDYYSKFFGIKLLSSWPALINEPHLVADAWASYVAVPLTLIGIIWYILAVQAFFARFFRINKLAKSIYNKDLSEFKFESENTAASSEANPKI